MFLSIHFEYQIFFDSLIKHYVLVYKPALHYDTRDRDFQNVTCEFLSVMVFMLLTMHAHDKS